MKKVQAGCARSIFNSFTAWARYYPSSGKDKEVSERWPDWLKSVYVWRLMCLAETKRIYMLGLFKLVFGNILSVTDAIPVCSGIRLIIMDSC